MNIGSVQNSSGGCEGARESKFKTIKEDFKKLQTALKSGDLKAAQDAYAALKQDLPQKGSSTSAAPGAPPTGTNTGTGTSSTSPSQPSTDLDALGTALQSGDLSAAQKAFATFKQDVQSARAAHGHHHGHHQAEDGDSNSGSSSTTTASATVSGLDSRSLNVQA